jgi:UDP-glucose 4-epimerase
VVVDDLSTGKKGNLAGIRAKLIPGSITYLNLKDAFEGATCVFHLAAIASVKKSVEDPLMTNEVGINGTLKILIAARDAGVKRLILASSAAVYGSSLQLPKREEMRPQPKSPYGVSKLAGENYA